METFDFNQGWPCFQDMPLEEAEIKEVNDSILELRPSLYLMQRLRKWTEKFFQPSLAVYWDDENENYFKKPKEWEMKTMEMSKEEFERQDKYCRENNTPEGPGCSKCPGKDMDKCADEIMRERGG